MKLDEPWRKTARNERELQREDQLPNLELDGSTADTPSPLMPNQHRADGAVPAE